MKLSPLDIKRQQFAKAFRGYEPVEVDAFVQQLASQWESVLEELRLSTERNRELEQKLKHYERVELALQEALETARESARRSEEAAERKAKIILEQAELKADRTLQDAEQERFGLRRDLAKLTGRQNEIAARLRAFLMSELEILAQFQGDDPVGFIRLESGTAPAGQLEARAAPALEPAQEADLDAADAPLAPADAPLADASVAEPAADASAADAPVNDEASASADAADAGAPEIASPRMEAFPSEAVDREAFDGEEIGSEEADDDAPMPVADGPDADADIVMTDEPSMPYTEEADATLGWDLPETVEPAPQAGADNEWNLRTLVTGENDSVAGSEAERERIRRILEDLD